MSGASDDANDDDVAIGRAVRLLRQRIGARQVDIGNRARVSQDEVSLIERGQLEAAESA